MIIRLLDPVIRQWIHTILISNYIQNLIMDVQVGVSREGLSATKLMNFLFHFLQFVNKNRYLNFMPLFQIGYLVCKVLIMRSWMESSVVSTMRYRLKFLIHGNGQDWDKLFLCFQEQILSLKNITTPKRECLILRVPVVYQRTVFTKPLDRNTKGNC